MKYRTPLILAILLLISIGNYLKISSGRSISAIMFVSVFSIGLAAGLLVAVLVNLWRGRK